MEVIVIFSLFFSQFRFGQIFSLRILFDQGHGRGEASIIQGAEGGGKKDTEVKLIVIITRTTMMKRTIAH